MTYIKLQFSFAGNSRYIKGERSRKRLTASLEVYLFENKRPLPLGLCSTPNGIQVKKILAL